MTPVRLLSTAARLGTAAFVALLALAIARWAPIEARAVFAVDALTAALPLLGLAILAALTGRERPATRWRTVGCGLVVAALALALAVAARGRAGLPASVESAAGAPLGVTPPAAIDLIGRDLRGLAPPRRVVVGWDGELRVPQSGRYRLWLEGRGRARVTLDGHPVVSGEGDPLRAAADIALARGPMRLAVRFEQTTPGPRVRLGWTRPDGRSEMVPARCLGPALPAWKWWLVDGLALLVAVLAGALVWLAPWDRRRVAPAPTAVGARELAWCALGYAALLAVMSWPLVLDLAHTGPFDRTDARLNAWILAWAGEAAWTQPSRLFQAPVFHPLPDALAFSENLLLPAVVVAPLVWLSGPMLAYDVALLGSLLLSGLGVYLLVRRATGDRLAAFVAGAYFAAGPQRWIRLAHLHAQVTVLLPLALLALDRFWERRTLRRALLVGLALALQGLSSIYLGAITAATLAVASAVALFGGLRPRELARLGAAFLVAGLVLWPVTRPYLRMRAFQGQEFTIETVASAAASLPSYAAAGTPAWGWATERLLDPTTLRDALFPGVTALVLGVVGLAAAPRRFRAVALAASLVAVVFSLGPETALYRFLHEHLVLVRGVRALSRFALVPSLALSVLAGLALAGRRRVLVAAALVAMMAESASLPLRLARYDGPSAAARWLAGKPGAVVTLPLEIDDTRVMLDGLAHRRPLVNGYAAFIPRPFDRALELLEHAPDDDALRFMRAVGVTHVVSAGAMPPPLREAAAFRESGPGATAQHVWEVPPGPSAAVVSAGDPAPTRFAAEGIVVVLPEPRLVERVAFELSDAPWVARPRLEVSDDGISWSALAAGASLADATLSLYRDPRHARGEVRFAATRARWLRLDPRLPVRAGTVEIGS